MIPEHMRETLDQWVKKGLPHPVDMDSFFRAVLTNNLKAAVMFADDENRASLVEWVFYLHNEVPSGAHGTEENILDWHHRGGLDGIEAAHAS